MKNERLFWVGGFLLGLVTGLAVGILYAWVLDPPVLSLTTPAALNQHDKEIYTVLIAAAYAQDGDMEQARERLNGLEDPDVESMVVSLAEQYIYENRDVRDVRALAQLADSMGQTTAAVRPFIATSTVTPTPSATATRKPTGTPTRPTVTPTTTHTSTPTRPKATVTATTTRVPTRTPTPPADRFRVAQSVVLCDDKMGGLLRIYVRDGAGKPMPGIQMAVTWPGGSDKLFTGFKPEVDLGYADFTMKAGEEYSVALVDVDSETAEAVRSDTQGTNTQGKQVCPDLKQGALPSWQVVFQLP